MDKKPRFVVSDTSPISAVCIGHLDLLRQIYGSVLIPNAVFDEPLALKKFEFDLRELILAD